MYVHGNQLTRTTDDEDDDDDGHTLNLSYYLTGVHTLSPVGNFGVQFWGTIVGYRTHQ